MNKYKISYEKELNSSQLETVNFNEGFLLVIAGAGSGKTRTITYRVARLLEEGVLPNEILLLTFTRKAATEMLNRASQLLDDRCYGVSGGTFHSFANLILRKYSKFLGFEKGFSIIDRVDAENLISLIVKENNYSKQNRLFPKKNTIMNIFSKSVNKNTDIEEIIYEEYSQFEFYIESLKSLYNEYIAHKKKHSFFDYDDLLIYLKELLKNYPDISDRIASRYKYLMVDEYQDTNKIQADIIYLLSKNIKNIMVVGDDSQSIYSFRGANFKNIIEFPKIFPDTKVITLEQNYRSSQKILGLTNQLIENAKEKFSKTLFSKINTKTVPILVKAQNENCQSIFIIDKIKEIIRQGTKLNEIAVLFRAGFHAFDLEIELAKANMPFIKVGGFKFMDSAHIKDVIAHIKILVNPDDRISWNRVLLLINKVGPKTAKKIFETIQKSNLGCKGITTVKPGKSYKNDFDNFSQFLLHLDPYSMSVYDIGEKVIEYYEPILESRFDDYPKRVKDLEQLLEIMKRYDSIDLFISDMMLEPPNTSVDGVMTQEEATDMNHLTLSTIHSAKGLEWDTVFIIWTLEGRFPSVHALKNEEIYEEELRLMYVAATRAKKNLIFIYPGQLFDYQTGLFFNQPSSFFSFVSDDLLVKKNFP